MMVFKAYTKEQAISMARAHINNNEDISLVSIDKITFSGNSYIDDYSGRENDPHIIVHTEELSFEEDFRIDIVQEGGVDAYACWQSAMWFEHLYDQDGNMKKIVVERVRNKADRWFIESIIAGSIKFCQKAHISLHHGAAQAEIQFGKYMENRNRDIDAYRTIYMPIASAPFDVWEG